MARSTVAVRFTGDTADLKRSLDQVDAKLKGTGSSISKVGKKLAVGLGVASAGVAVLGKSAVDAGSSLNETLSKSNTVFGGQAKAIEAWAGTAAKGFGQSKQQALEAASSFGNMFTQLGIGEKQAAAMSTQMTQLASDFASFHNADITQVLEAQQAAFRGEYDALQRFVPTISAATVEQKALAQTGKKTTKELTIQEKALAVQALMMEGAGDAAGDFARTSDGLANRQRIMSAQFKDFQAQLGQKLIPVVLKVADIFLNRVLPAFSAVGQFISEHKPVFIALAAVIGGALVAALGAWAVSATAAAAATIAAMAPVIAIGAAIGALVAGVIYAYKHWGFFKTAVDAVARFLTEKLWPALQSVAGFIRDVVIPVVLRVIGVYVAFYRKVAEVAIGVVTKLVEIGAGIARFVDNARAKFSGLIGFLWGLPRKVSDIAGRIWEGLKNGLAAVVRWVLNKLDSLLGPLDEIAGKVGGLLSKGGGLISKGLGVLGIEAKAAGGPVTAGRPYLVGENGPELFSPTRSGRIIPNGATASGTTYNISVSVAPGGDPAATGKAVVEVIKAYERRSGTAWRAS